MHRNSLSSRRGRSSPPDDKFAEQLGSPVGRSGRGGAYGIGPAESNPHEDQDAQRSPPAGRGGRGGGYGYGRGNSYRSGLGSHSSSRKWQSRPTTEYDEFRVVRNAMQRIFPRSEVSKWTQVEYLKHKEDYLADLAEEMKAKVTVKEEEKDLGVLPIAEPFDGKLPENNVGPVLGQKTIWCQNWTNGKDEISPWPSYAEMKWEGDDRAKTNVHRHLALPREEGIPTIHWQHIPVVKQYPLDKVNRVPTLEDTHAPIEEIRVLDAFNLVQRSLVEHIDKFNLYLVHAKYLDSLRENDSENYRKEMLRYNSLNFYVAPENDWASLEKAQAQNTQSRSARSQQDQEDLENSYSLLENAFSSPGNYTTPSRYSGTENHPSRASNRSRLDPTYSTYGTEYTPQQDNYPHGGGYSQGGTYYYY